AVKNVWVRTPQAGSRKIPKTNFTHRVGTVSDSDSAMKLLDLVRATLRTIFRPRLELRVPRFFFDLRFVAKSSADYADLRRRKQDRTCESRISLMLVRQALRLPTRQSERLPCNGQRAAVTRVPCRRRCGCRS